MKTILLLQGDEKEKFVIITLEGHKDFISLVVENLEKYAEKEGIDLE